MRLLRFSGLGATLRRVVCVLGWSAAGLQAAGTAPAEPAPPPPGRPLNVIVILADDMGWGDLGCQGHPFVKTPNLDRLAASGCRLDQFYVSAPVCSPSRAGLLTGRIQSRFGLQHIIRDHGPKLPRVLSGTLTAPPVFHHVPLEEPTLPRLLQTVGFTTAHIGKWHLSFIGHPGEPTMRDYGYDHAMELEAFERYGEYYNSPWWRNGVRMVTTGMWTDAVYVDDAIDFMEKAGDRPFFINLWSYAPHMEVECDKRFRAMYADRTTDEQYYYGTITQMDEQYGRLLDYLDRKGLTQNTIIFFSSDNGPPPHTMSITNRAQGSTGGLRGSKYCLYEGGIREPGIVRWPGLTTPGSVTHEVCWTPDILATLAAAFGVKLPDLPFDGMDIRPALRGEHLVRAEPLYWQYPFRNAFRDGTEDSSPGLALRSGPWKLHCDLRFGHVELYNLDIDRNEQWNLAMMQPEVVGDLLKKMQDMFAEINGPYSRTAHSFNPQMPVGSDAPKLK